MFGCDFDRLFINKCRQITATIYFSSIIEVAENGHSNRIVTCSLTNPQDNHGPSTSREKGAEHTMMMMMMMMMTMMMTMMMHYHHNRVANGPQQTANRTEQ
jgi:hypothetical protein